MTDDSVIAAIASPAGPCARIVLRISGKGSHALVSKVLAVPRDLPDRGVIRQRLAIGKLEFPALIILFPQFHSYTGEESAELHLPGNPLLAAKVLSTLYDHGARSAEPGEFTARAFFAGRLDLTEAEGVAATICATNERELNAARRLQCGELTRRLRPITDDLTQTLSLLEAGIDFAEEDIRFISARDLAARAAAVRDRLTQLLSASSRFEQLSHEPTIVLCGRPNAGKSTLLNALAGRPRAVVSPTAGTTRDLLSADITLPHGTVKLLDTAGLEEIHETASATDKPVHALIAQQMHAKATQAIHAADVLVLVIEAGDARSPLTLPRQPDAVVISKADTACPSTDPSTLQVSALTGTGIDLLRRELDRLAFGSTGGEALALNARHLRQIELACAELDRLAQSGEGAGGEHVEQGEELLAEHLRYALDALGEITGIVSPDEVLGRIFSSFCIGK